MSKLEERLSQLFERYRLVFWYDADSRFKDEIESLSILGIDKLFITNNEFALKHQILYHPTQKFLVYKEGACPENEDNWLLDLQMANHVFETDQVGLILQELELPQSRRKWAEQHVSFFQNKKRLAGYSARITPDFSETELSYVLLQTVLKANGSLLDDILRKSTELLIKGDWESCMEEIKLYGLDRFLWHCLEENYNYVSNDPSLYDFLLELFQRSFKPTSKNSKLNSGAEVLIAGWKDARSFESIFIKLSNRIEKDLAIRDKLAELSLDELLEEDLFESVEQQIINRLIQELANEQPSIPLIEGALKERETSYWTNHKYDSFYKAIFYGAALFQFIKLKHSDKISNLTSGIEQYVKEEYKADMYYRLFLENFRKTKQNNVLAPLYEKVHKAYSNSWLLRQSTHWQSAIENESAWYQGIKSQRNFFKDRVQKEFLEQDKKLFVVISDALRFENGVELHQKFAEEARFKSQLDYQVAGLPSYTQLGMASLLPHEELALDNEALIWADGKSTAGSLGRLKILEESSGVKSTVISAEDLMKLKSKGEEAKSLVQNNDLIYIYHNRIDKVGDDKMSEDKVIEAVREEIDFLLDVAKKITNMNGTNILITSDHGFIYQNEVLEQSDFSDAEVSGVIIKENRRFVIGKNLKHNNNVIKFSAKDLALNNEFDILIPKGINRLRKQGAGSRFVHGGASLQEVVVPVVWVTKQKADTVEKVGIELLSKSNNRITTNIHTVRFYQVDPIGKGIIPRAIKSYFAIQENDTFKPISDIFNYRFDSDSKRTEDREVVNKFTLSTSIRQSQSVYLVIQEAVEGTNKWNLISKFPYSLTLTMENDFDDF